MKNRTKANLQFAFSAAGFLLSAALLFKVSSLEKKISLTQDNIQNTISYSTDNISGRISNISSNIRNALEESASIITYSNCEVGGADFSKLTAPVTFKITPKEYTEGMEAVLYADGNPYPMEYKNGDFTCSINAYIFDNFQAEKIVLKKGNTYISQSTEDLYIDLKDIFLPYIDCTMPLSWSFTYGSGKTVAKCSEGVDINYTFPEEAKVNIKSAKAIVKIGGKTEDEIPVEITSYTGYANGYAYIEKSYEIPANSSLETYVETKTNNGLTYKNIIQSFRTDENGNVIDDDKYYDSNIYEVYDKNGNLVFTNDYS